MTTYIETNRAPDVRDFTYTLPEFPNLKVMPSGKPSDQYPTKSRNINWGMLYSERDGYLLFEDLKAQWHKYLNPDYVFIDTSSGYTDTGAICTRQLPDSVTVLFFPNEQNRRGLGRVVKDIQDEAQTPRKKFIDLKFVMSNVPDLDDEDGVLSRIKRRFKSSLELDDEPQIIHRVESLSLLNQAIFVKKRPKSRLAREYSELADRIVNGNLADRDGAMNHIESKLKDLLPPLSNQASSTSTEDSDDKAISAIERAHAEDCGILVKLADLQFKRGKLTVAEDLLDKSIDGLKIEDLDAYSLRAEVRSNLGRHEDASNDALNVLNRNDVSPPTVMKMCRYIQDVDGEMVASLPAITELDPSWRIELANVLSCTNQPVYAQAILLKTLEDQDYSEEARSLAKADLGNSYIRNKAYEKAAALFSSDGQIAVKEMLIPDAFNYGVALWGKTDEIEPEPFQHVVGLNEQVPPKEPTPNYHQCLALASWAVGDVSKANKRLAQARETIESQVYEFSSWRYERVSRTVFREDLDEMERMISGDTTTKPRFLGFVE